jgi:hypothetical protein
VTSLNGFQAEADSDGITRFVIAHRDPAVPNWLDTTGQTRGFLTVRWTYPEPPDELPKVKVITTPLGDVRQHLPAATRVMSPDERNEQIRIRQEHVQRRYRQY